MSPQNGSKPEISLALDVHARSSKKGSIKRWIFLGFIVLSLVLFLYFLLSKKEATITYKTAPVTQGDMTITVTATGTLQPLNQVQVGSEISGLIEEVLVDYNDTVTKNQVLAKLNTDQLKSKLQQTEASLELAQAKLNDAEATVNETENRWMRKQELAKENMCSPEECDTAKAEFLRAKASVASANAQVMQAKAQVDSDRSTMKKAMIRAPINGIVLSRNVEPGQTVAASFQTPVLFTLAEDLTRMELHVDIDEADVGQVQTKQHANFTVDAYPQRKFSAKITNVYYAPKVVQDVVTYEALLSVDNSEMLLRPGMTATAEIVTKKISNTLLVPNTALRFSPTINQGSNGKKTSSVLRSILPGPPPRPPKQRTDKETKADSQKVWILKDSVPTPIHVTVGASNGRMTEVLSGDIQPGMALLVDVVRASK